MKSSNTGPLYSKSYNGTCLDASIPIQAFYMLKLSTRSWSTPLTLFRMALFVVIHRWQRAKGFPSKNLSHILYITMKFGTVITYIKKTQNIYKSSDTSHEFLWHQHLFTEISNFCYIEKYRYRLYFNT